MKRAREFVSALVAAFCVLSMIPVAAAAQDDAAGSTRSTGGFEHGNFGIGVVFGEPTGLSGKMWTTQNTAFDIGLAWSFADNGNLHIFADYLFHNFSLFNVSKGTLPVYVGIGGRLMFRDNQDDKFGVRFPVGVEYYFDGWPIAVFGEVVPILDLAPSTTGDIGGGVGVRFYF